MALFRVNSIGYNLVWKQRSGSFQESGNHLWVTHAFLGKAGWLLASPAPFSDSYWKHLRYLGETCIPSLTRPAARSRQETTDEDGAHIHICSPAHLQLAEEKKSHEIVQQLNVSLPSPSPSIPLLPEFPHWDQGWESYRNVRGHTQTVTCILSFFNLCKRD